MMQEILGCNSASKAHEDLWSRTRQATDMVGQAAADARDADLERDRADLDHKAMQAENPERRASRPRQWLLAGGVLALDGVACYFAAEALGGSQPETLAWAVLFLALLGGGELALDHYRDDHHVLWRWIAVVLGAFIGMLGTLRFSFLVTVGSEGSVAAIAGASLFTVTTAGFVVIGYRALRVAETGQAWGARRRARACAIAADAAHRMLNQRIAHRDRLACAYLSRIRLRLIQSCTASELPPMEQAIWAHLVGQDAHLVRQDLS
jgi:hypothetical protein